MLSSAILTVVAAAAALASPLETRAIPSCHYSEAPTNKEWRIIVKDDTKYNTNCGRGVLDNARGRCGNIEAWECMYTDADRGVAVITFRSPKACRGDDITAAIKAAFGGAGPQCGRGLGDQVTGSSARDDGRPYESVDAGAGARRGADNGA